MIKGTAHETLKADAVQLQPCREKSQGDSIVSPLSSNPIWRKSEGMNLWLSLIQ